MKTGKSALRLYVGAWITFFGLAFTATTQAAFVLTGGFSNPFPVIGNDYNNDLTGLGFTTMRESGQLSVNMDGFVTFRLVGAESTYSNTFTAGSESITEPRDNDNLTDPKTPFAFGGVPGAPVITIAVTAGDILNFQFSNDTNSNTVDNLAGINLFDLGIVYDFAATSLDQLVLAYDDTYCKWCFWGVEDNHDDMLIRADFRPIPVPPAVWLFGSGLIGLVAIARRKKTS